MFWMTNGRKLHITFSNLLALFKIMDDDKDFPKLNDEGLLEPEVMSFMYPRDKRD
jgi:hypothetical protein